MYASLVFELDHGSNILYAVLGRSLVEQKLDEEFIVKTLAKNDHQSLYREEDAIRKLLKSISTFEEGRFEFARKLAARVVIEVTDDRMQAFVSTFPPHVGATLS